MSKLDESKERLGLLKFWLGILIGSFLAIGGWLVTNYVIRGLLVTNYNKSDILIILVSFIILIGLFIAILIINNKIEKILKDIRDL